MKRYFLISLAIILAHTSLIATEGMWLPHLLKQLNESEMQAMGMKLTAEDIYSVNRGSLKDAIVSFGGFCTGEIISAQGLLLTNHHCGYGRIQSHSTMENNYLQNGFWAANRAEELPNPGLFVTFIVRIEDVTAEALSGVDPRMAPSERQKTIDLNLNSIRSSYQIPEYQDILIKPFFKGNQYFLFITETYRDVRLVGAPPSSIGKFGADTDNWEWPRHTGDFSLFRVYAGPDNKPAEYDPANQPLQPKHFLPVSLDGVSAGDFTMVFGFPGRTNEYLPASAVKMQVDVLNPIKVGIRTRALEVIDAAMRNDPEVRLQYASKQASISNAWKKWKGESLGVHRTGGIQKKLELEEEFNKRVAARPEWKPQYRDLLNELNALYEKIEPYAKTANAVSEIGGRNIELFRLTGILKRYVRLYQESGPEAFKQRADRLISYLEGFQEDYRPEIDKEVFKALMQYYFEEVNGEHISDFVVQTFQEAGKDYDRYADKVFSGSLLTKPAKIAEGLRSQPEQVIEAIERDLAYRLHEEMMRDNDRLVMEPYNKLNAQISELQRVYMTGLMEVFPERRFYPDANSTMRVSYGKVEAYEPRDAIVYSPVTYLKGVIEKYKPGDYEFDVPDKLIQLYRTKDYGPYGEDGKMPVCFLGSNHTTGGNSGSPAIDGSGNLIGLNFDRTWEGTMSDINYDPSICRNIMVDIRYVLFIIDKFAGAGHLVEEMKLVHPKG